MTSNSLEKYIVTLANAPAYLGDQLFKNEKEVLQNIHNLFQKNRQDIPEPTLCKLYKILEKYESIVIAKTEAAFLELPLQNRTI